MNKKVLYIVISVVFIIALIVTAIAGLRVDLNYAEANEVVFSLNKELKIQDVKEMANTIWRKSEVQRLEFYGDSVLIKVKEVTDEQVNDLCNKVNERYETELKPENVSITHISNVKLRDVIKPYIIPIGLSTLLIAGYYAIKYKDVKKMLSLLKYLVISEGILYSIYAILRVPVNELTMPIAIILYTLVVFITTIKSEFKKE